MTSGERGALQPLVLTALLAALVGTAAAAGLAVTDDDPTGQEVLESVDERYDEADSVVVDATVTVENETTSEQVDVSLATAGDDRARVNVTNGTAYVVTGVDGDTAWVQHSEANVTLVVEDLNATVDPEAETVTVNATVPSGVENDSAVGAVVDVGELAAESNASEEYNVTAALERLQSGDYGDYDFEDTNLTAERVETTTLDGEEAHVVSVTHPESEGEQRLWVATDDSEVLRQELRTPNGTVTVDVTETRFDVEVADSTFQPPADGTVNPTTAESLDELREASPYALAVPDDDWTFERGAVVSYPEVAVIGQYADDGTNITVAQSAVTPPGVEDDDDTETIEVGNRTVTVVSDEERTTGWWTEDDVTTAVSGNITQDELRDVVAGIEFEE